MLGLFRRKKTQPDLVFASKGYLQVAVARRYSPHLDLHVLERGFAEQLLNEGCTTEQALSARWGGVCAINDDLSEFDNAIAAVKEARLEAGLSEKMSSKMEAEAMYRASALAVVTLFNTLVPKDYGSFLKYINAR